MEGGTTARLVAVLFLAIVMTVTLISMERTGEMPVLPGRPNQSQPEDPLRKEQRRCQQMGEAAAGDADCLRVWAETRDRFLGRTPVLAAPPPTSEGE